jgi:uncharacterized protein YdaU (DUF1376 family)
VNYYPHHIGDYAKDTNHLSWDEDMAYTRLLRAYYAREAPIPASEAYRLARASSKAQKAAVDAVLNEFFKREHDGWHNKRADEEIVRAREEGEDSQAKKENERERQRRHRQRRKELFEELRVFGIVPKWDTPFEQLEAILSREQQRAGHKPVTRDSTVTNTDLQRLSISQEPLANTKEEPIASRDSRAPPAVNGEAVAYIPLNNGSEWGVSKEFLAELEKAYPVVDGPQTLKEIRVWCLANPAKRKTKSGVARFVNNWFAREQDGPQNRR